MLEKKSPKRFAQKQMERAAIVIVPLAIMGMLFLSNHFLANRVECWHFESPDSTELIGSEGAGCYTADAVEALATVSDNCQWQRDYLEEQLADLQESPLTIETEPWEGPL